MSDLNTEPIELSQNAIEQAIRSNPAWDGTPEAPMMGDMADLVDGFGGGSFRHEVATVWMALIKGPLATTHLIDLVWQEDIEFHSTSMVGLEVVLPTAGRIKAAWIMTSELTSDRDATGIKALVAIANELIHHANNSLEVAEPLIEDQLDAKAWNGLT